MAEVLVNTLLARTGDSDAVLDGAITDSQTTLDLLVVPANLPASGTLRARIGIEGTSDDNDEIIKLTLPPTGSTFTIEREAEEAAYLPKCAHSDGAQLYLDLTEGGLADYITEHALSVGASAAAQHKVLGYDAIGASVESMPIRRVYAKQIMLTAPGLLSSISGRITETSSGLQGFAAAVFTDNAGLYDEVIAESWQQASPHGSVANRPRWMAIPIGIWLEAGTYWIGFQWRATTGGAVDLAYDAGGSDHYYDAGANDTITDEGAFADNTTARNYSIRADFLEAVVIENAGGVLGTAVFSATGGTVHDASYDGVIASVVRNSAGNFTVNFTAPLSDPYTIALTCSSDLTDVMTAYINSSSIGSSSFDFATVTLTTGPAGRDPGVVTVAVMQAGSGGSSGDVVKIAEVTPAGANNVDFSAIPSTYKNLKIVWQAGGSDASPQEIKLQINGDTGANYTVTYEFIRGTNTLVNGVEAGGHTGLYVAAVPPSGGPAGLVSQGEILIHNYKGTDFQKTAQATMLHFDGTFIYNFVGGGWWANTAAINEVKLVLAAGNFVAGTVFTLYGIK